MFHHSEQQKPTLGMAWVFPALVTVLVCAVAKWIWDRRTAQTTWERLGVKGPKASSLLLGNLRQIAKEGRRKVEREWTQKYGKVFGYYEGTTPVLCIADPDMVKEILIKQFSNFGHRQLGGDRSNKDKFVGMFAAQGPKWKRLRDVSTPTFSGKKMKMMSPLVDNSIHKLIDKFEERVKNDEAFDIYEDFKRLTLDAIATTVFSYETDTFNSEDSLFLRKFKVVFEQISLQRMTPLRKLFFMLVNVFPNLGKLLNYFGLALSLPSRQWFLNLAKNMIRERQASGEVRDDYLQLMINLQRKENRELNDSNTDVSDGEGPVGHMMKSSSNKFLEMEEMQGVTFTFLAAGYETTATTLAFAAYYLAVYPEVQGKLQEEIDEYFPIKGKNIGYETVQKLPYLDMVFCEVSRLAQIANLAVQRHCTQTTKIGNITIPKGTKVQVNVQDIHMNPDLWGPEPVDQLVPERFLPDRKGERHSMAFLPFGAGPRNCIGMRFAVMEAKMALINLLQRFSIVKCQETQVPLQCNQDGVHAPKDGVRVKLNKRS